MINYEIVDRSMVFDDDNFMTTWTAKTVTSLTIFLTIMALIPVGLMLLTSKRISHFGG